MSDEHLVRTFLYPTYPVRLDVTNGIRMSKQRRKKNHLHRFIGLFIGLGVVERESVSGSNDLASCERRRRGGGGGGASSFIVAVAVTIAVAVAQLVPVCRRMTGAHRGGLA
jgi:hypothetical protein